MTPQRSSVKFCRYCGRLIKLETTDCPYCGRNTIRLPEGAVCPFCREPIRTRAVKCRHCGEFLDGRGAAGGPLPQTLVYIDKAVVTGGDGPPELRAQPPGVLPGEAGHEVPGHPRLSGGQKALPIGTPAPRAGRQHPRTPAAAPRVPAPTTVPPPAPAQPVRYDCPSCGRHVYEGDNFCESCGRDLSLPVKAKQFVRTELYARVDYAVMFGFGAPIGVILPGVLSYTVAAAGLVTGLWCVGRITASWGELRGLPPAIGGMFAGLFWLLILAAFRG